MDRFDFLEIITGILEEGNSEEAIEMRAKEMIQMILSQKELSKLYFKNGLLKRKEED